MIDTPRAGTPVPSPDSQIEDACVRFEDAWKAGRRPVLERFLDEPPPGGRTALLAELLKLELYYRRRAGERPTPDDYLARFPDDLPAVRDVFNDAVAGPTDHDAAGPAAQAAVAGRYKLLELVGEGGMGEVWAAEQTRPVRRKVALKQIKAGMDSKAVLARFAAESQALSLMDHPNIAKVLDAGRTAAGRPFFAMEFIQGTPITRYCDDARLGIRARVGLFLPVCEAVQHAHQKGVIHRDLKPSNVLVAAYDGKPVPKIIDFGLAKAMHQPLTEHTLHTAPGLILGTPPYMSPEQAELNNPDIDTRTDVYALGVILYELLTGTTPVEGTRFRDGGWPEVLRLIREEEPPRPSTRLGDGGTLLEVAARRNVDPARLTKQVRGELDWIVMKCLEKDRSRRYETASGLALDLQRYLAGDPVLAAPPGAAYRVRKFLRKNRGPVAAVAAVVLALVAGVVGTAVGLARAEGARQRAALKEAEAAAALTFVEEKVFAAARPLRLDGGLGRDVTLIDALRAALPYVEKSFADQPLVEARLRATFAHSFLCAGDAAAAEVQGRAALQLRSAHLGPDHPDTLASLHGMADTYQEQGRYVEALKLHDGVLRRRTTALGPLHPDTITSTASLAETNAVLDHNPQALRLREQVLAARRSVLGPDHSDTLEGMLAVANSYSRLGRHSEARRLREQVLAIRRSVLGPHDPATLWTMISLSHSYADRGRFAEALKLCEEVLPQMRSIFGPDHPHTLVAMQYLSLRHSDAGHHEEALQLRRETLALREAKSSPNHPATLWSLWAVTESLVHRRLGDEAAELIDEGLRRAAGKAENRRLIQVLLIQDLRRLVARTGPAERRAWAKDWETPNASDPISLYDAACFRSLLAAVIPNDPKTPPEDAPGLAAAEADHAMQWLRRAVAAGYQNAANMEKDPDLDALRGRDDFKQLLASLREQAAAVPVPLP